MSEAARFAIVAPGSADGGALAGSGAGGSCGAGGREAMRLQLLKSSALSTSAVRGRGRLAACTVR